ncbi:MAG: hypothetical protein WD605_00340, partial [Candidatus Paceibacterota bacterium]
PPPPPPPPPPPLLALTSMEYRALVFLCDNISMEAQIPLLAELFFYLALQIVIVYALVFGYHWFQYGTNKKHSTLALTIFMIGAGSLLFVMFLSLQYVN